MPAGHFTPLHATARHRTQNTAPGTHKATARHFTPLHPSLHFTHATADFLHPRCYGYSRVSPLVTSESAFFKRRHAPRRGSVPGCFLCHRWASLMQCFACLLVREPTAEFRRNCTAKQAKSDSQGYRQETVFAVAAQRVVIGMHRNWEQWCLMVCGRKDTAHHRLAAIAKSVKPRSSDDYVSTRRRKG